MHGHRQVFGFPVPVNEPPSPIQHPAETDFYSSVEDMTHYIQTYFNAGQYGNRQIATPLQAANSQRSGGWFDIYWQWYAGSPTSDKRPGHEGGTSTFNAGLLLYPAEKAGVILIANTRLVGAADGEYDTAMTIASGVLDIIHGRLPQSLDVSAFNAYYNQLILMIAIPFVLAL